MTKPPDDRCTPPGKAAEKAARAARLAEELRANLRRRKARARARATALADRDAGGAGEPGTGDADAAIVSPRFPE